MSETPRKELAISDELVVELQHVHKWYGTFHVLKDINLTVRRGERIKSYVAHPAVENPQ